MTDKVLVTGKEEKDDGCRIQVNSSHFLLSSFFPRSSGLSSSKSYIDGRVYVPLREKDKGFLVLRR